MSSLYWLEEALQGLAPALGMSLGVGLPWALALLPRRRWRSRALTAALALALGPAWAAAWMLLLGVVGGQTSRRLLTAEAILLGCLFIAAAGFCLAWRRRGEADGGGRAPPLMPDEKLITACIVIAIALRWIHTAFWSFTAYDALWVFGYQGRLFFLEGMIPPALDYYPPFVSLQYAFAQILLGEINDHAARMVLPMLHIGSVLAAYVLGMRLAGRRIGLITAAIWSLHPYVGQWAHVGDLEIPLTFSFTLAAAFFLPAWLDPGGADARRDSLLAGLALGIALFTKPTAGAFVWGVLLLLALELARNRFDLRACLPRTRVALWTGAACLPLGGVWYLRNLALGHEAVTFPDALWLTRALRSGDYLAPWAIAVAAGFIAVTLSRRRSRSELALGAAGILLLGAGIVASNPRLFPARVDPPQSYVQPIELAMLLCGSIFVAQGSRSAARGKLSADVRRLLAAGAAAALLALPYFLTLFFSYSYHFRLGFAIVPLLAVPTAIALGQILSRERVAHWSDRTRRAYHALLLLLCLPGVMAAAIDAHTASFWLLNDALDSERKKAQAFNPSLLEVVAGLEAFQRDTGREPIVLAPGEERLPFFFPQTRVIDKPVTTLYELEDLGASHIVYGAKSREGYLRAGIEPAQTQLIAALGRLDLFKKTAWHYDGAFSYELYETRDLAARRVLPEPYATGPGSENEVVFGDRLRAWTQGVYPQLIHRDTPITFQPSWRALGPLERDYEFALRLLEASSGDITQEWRFRAGAHRYGHYATQLWDADEFVNDLQILRLDPGLELPRREDFVFALGVWDAVDQRYLPLTVNGEPAGEFHQLIGLYRLAA